jgi:hypothetical protein
LGLRFYQLLSKEVGGFVMQDQQQQLQFIVAIAATFVVMGTIFIIIAQLLKLVPAVVAIAIVVGAFYFFNQNYDNTSLEVMKKVVDQEFQGEDNTVFMVNQFGIPTSLLNKLKEYKPLTFVQVDDKEFNNQKLNELRNQYNRPVVGVRFTIDVASTYAKVSIIRLNQVAWHVWQTDYDLKAKTWKTAFLVR